MDAPAASRLYQSFCYQNFSNTTGANCWLSTVLAGETLFVESVMANTVGTGAQTTSVWLVAGGEGVVLVPMFTQGAASEQREPWLDASLCPGDHARMFLPG